MFKNENSRPINNSIITSDNLTKKEVEAKIFLTEHFLPELRKAFQRANPAKYAQYHGNCCRQVAVASKYILDKVLPETKWKLYDLDLKGPLGKYDHAFVVGKRPDGKFLLVDLERNPVWPNVFAIIDSFQDRHPHKNFEAFKDEEVLKTNNANYMTWLIDTKEFYTMRIGKELYDQVLINVMHKNLIYSILNYWGDDDNDKSRKREGTE